MTHRLLSTIRFALAALWAVSWSTGAFAHAVLMESSPKAGQMFDTSPKEISVTFNENVGPIFFKILDKTGKDVGSPGEIKIDGYKLTLPLNATLPNGTYVLTYRVISADTHPVGATFGFSVGEPMADTSQMSAGADSASTPWTFAVSANRWLLYATMLLAAGSALFTILVQSPGAVGAAAYGLGRKAAAVAAISYILSIGIGGAEMVMGGGGALFSLDTWIRGTQSTLTPSAAIGVPAMLILIWAYGHGSAQPKTGALLVGSAAAVASFLVTGHAATAAPVWLTAPMVAVHLACTAFWLGALYPLLVSTTAVSAKESGAIMTQFSLRAVYTVTAIALSGAVISWVQLESPANLFGNQYGASLTRKLLLFVIILGFAAYNKMVLTPALESGKAGSESRIRRSIRIEYVIYVLILGAAMSLTLTTPPRAIVDQGGAGMGGMAMDGIKTSIKNDKYTADLEITPAKAGENMIMVTVKGADGQVLKVSDVEMVANLEAAGISDLTVKGERLPNEMWHIMVKDMIIPGEWSVRIDVFIDDFDKVGFETKAQIK
jgi:copper transport protein